MTMQFDDETLMAFADGELPEAEAAPLRRALAADPAVAARIETFRRARAAVAGLAPAPAPAALEARIRALAATGPATAASAPAGAGADVVPLASRRRVPAWQVPAAAAAALVLGLSVALLTRPADDAAERAALLDSLPSGESRPVAGGEIAVVATFRDAGGLLCREYEETTAGRRMVSVACRGAEGWDLRLAIAAGGEAGYAPASSLDALDAWAAANGAGAPMSPAEEAAALAGLR